MGVGDHHETAEIGVDIPFETVREDFDAVLLGIGAWISTGVGCKGEDADGVIGGIDFLRKVVRNEEIELGEKVAIVGGGNTAMDACRTAVRLGAKEVYNIYRRTKDEMPADMVEIEEAEEEGVIFKNLTNPLEVIKDENGHAKRSRAAGDGTRRAGRVRQKKADPGRRQDGNHRDRHDDPGNRTGCRRIYLRMRQDEKERDRIR